MKKKTIYLCGGMAGCSDEECMQWRNQVISEFSEMYDFRNPMVRDYRNMDSFDMKDYYKEIVGGDLKDIDESDILFVKADKPSWGTAMEVHYAHSKNKQIITFCNADKPSPWLLYHSTNFFKTIEEALDFLDQQAMIEIQDNVYENRSIGPTMYR